jgi:hypothetical protein
MVIIFIDQVTIVQESISFEHAMGSYVCDSAVYPHHT